MCCINVDKFPSPCAESTWMGANSGARGSSCLISFSIPGFQRYVGALSEPPGATALAVGPGRRAEAAEEGDWVEEEQSSMVAR